MFVNTPYGPAAMRPHHAFKLISAIASLTWIGAHAAPSPASPITLPAPIAAQLARAEVPASALALWVQATDDAATPRIRWNSEAPMNPASVFKLVTTTAALDILGPAWTWKTPVGLTGPIRHGVLEGSLVIRGSGDPSLVMERVWLLLRRVREMGVETIAGDIVLDHSAFTATSRSPAEFDGEPGEPYNVQPDALMLNFKAVTLRFMPEPELNVARVATQPSLAGVSADTTVPLTGGACGDWRAALKLAPPTAAGWRFNGAYRASCGERTWPLAYSEPESYDTRMIAAMWREVGGVLKGSVRDGVAPSPVRPAFEFESPPLTAVIRDINKFSNNVMAEQLFFSLAPSLANTAADTGIEPARHKNMGAPPHARDVLSQWLRTRLGATTDETTIINGSGLARETRISAHTLAQLLQWVWRNPGMPDLMASLPLNGVDGTLRRSGAVAGRAYLKTGSIRDVIAIAGYVLGDSGRRYVLIAIINDPRASAARGALDAAIEWVRQDAPPAATRTAIPAIMPSH